MRTVTMSKADQKPRKKPTLAALRRAVASSTALETGESVRQLELKLSRPNRQKFHHIKLAA